MRKYIFLFLFLFAADHVDAQRVIQAFTRKTNTERLEETIFLFYFEGQSNAAGRETTDRLLAIGEDSEPTNVFVYYKPDYTATDNGSFVQLEEGSVNTREPGETPLGLSGWYGMLGNRLAALSPNPVYVIMAGDGGTALKPGLTNPDWDPAASGECYDIFTNRYFIVAYNKLVAANPGKTIEVVRVWSQGESDALDADGISGYSTRFAAKEAATRNAHAALKYAPLIIPKLYFTINAGEGVINSVFQSYENNNPNYVKTIDISAYPRIIDLTTEQKLGFASVGGDSPHTSYLGQLELVAQSLAFIKIFYPFIP